MTEAPRPPVALEEFRALMREAGVEEVVDEAIGAFLAETPLRLQNLEAAASGGDPEAVGQLAHAVKSASGAIHAHGLSEHALRLEMAGREGRTDEITALHAGMRAEADRVLAYLASVMSSGSEHS